MVPESDLINMKITAIVALLAPLTVVSLARPEIPADLAAEHEEEGIVDLLDLEVPHHNDTEVEEEVKEIVAEDWADTWDPPEYMKEWFPYRITGKDDEGAVVFLKQFGKWKFSELVRTKGRESRDLFDKYYEQYLHRFLKEGEANGGAIIIFDWDGFTLSNFDNREAVKLMLRQLTTLEKTSKVLKHTFIVNTNFAAQTMMNVARPLMGTVLQGAEIYGTKRGKWLPRLLKKLPKSVLPPHYFESEIREHS